MIPTTRVCCALAAPNHESAPQNGRKDFALGCLVGCAGFVQAGRLIASNLDYDLPFIPVVMVISPICIGMCMLLRRFAPRVFRREQRSPKTEAVDMAPAEPGTLLPGGGPPTAPRS